MSQTRFIAPKLFNPGAQPPEEIMANFVIRLREFDELFAAIKTDAMTVPPQHYLIQGQRGFGKTTLLLRLDLEIKNDPQLRPWLLPVMFDEEQYGIRTLAKLWEEVASIIEEDDEDFSGLSKQVGPLYDKRSPEEEIFNLLLDSLKDKNKKIVLLLDNFGDMIEKFTRKENQRLREVLNTCSHLRLIGASSKVLEFYHDYKEPLYDFFKVIMLDELDRDETLSLLKNLGEIYHAEETLNMIEKQPARVEALRRLLGGVPRSIVMLFEVFMEDIEGNPVNDLEAILDRVTPLYKERLDRLSTQQQAIVDAIARNWDAMSTGEVAKTTRMESKAVASQLNQLEKTHLIRKIPTSTKNHLYQLNERFFNIYYLMRLGKPKNRNKVLWLLRFLEIWCGNEIQEAFRPAPTPPTALGRVISLLRNNEFPEAFTVFKSNLQNAEMFEEVDVSLSEVFLMFMAKKQHNYMYNFFEEKCEMREKYKAIYYALLSVMGKEHADELKRMGPELQETVTEIVRAVETMAVENA